MSHARQQWLQLLAGIAVELLRLALVTLIAGLILTAFLAVFFALAWLAAFA